MQGCPELVVYSSLVVDMASGSVAAMAVADPGSTIRLGALITEQINVFAGFSVSLHLSCHSTSGGWRRLLSFINPRSRFRSRCLEHKSPSHIFSFISLTHDFEQLSKEPGHMPDVDDQMRRGQVVE